MAFKFLDSLGFHFAVLEDKAAWRSCLGFSSKLNPRAHLLYPVPRVRLETQRKETSDDCCSPKAFRVGVVGVPRDEKGGAILMEALSNQIKSGRGDIKLVIGAPKRSWSQLSPQVAAQAELVDTSDHADYLRCLESCHLLLLPYPTEIYSYRVSGVLSDAASVRTPVVVRRMPTLSHQVNYPVPVGLECDSDSEILDVLQNTALRGRKFDFDRYIAVRSEDLRIEMEE